MAQDACNLTSLSRALETRLARQLESAGLHLQSNGHAWRILTSGHQVLIDRNHMGAALSLDDVADIAQLARLVR